MIATLVIINKKKQTKALLEKYLFKLEEKNMFLKRTYGDF